MAKTAQELIQKLTENSKYGDEAELYARTLKTSCVLVNVETGETLPWPDDCDDQADYVQALAETMDIPDGTTTLETADGSVEVRTYV